MIEVCQEVIDPITLEIVEEVTIINIEVGDYIGGGGEDIEIDESLHYYDVEGVKILASNISTFSSKFIWKTGDSTNFTLPFAPTHLIEIKINGLALYKASQYTIVLPNQIEILQTLFNDDVVEFIYEHYNLIP